MVKTKRHGKRRRRRTEPTDQSYEVIQATPGPAWTPPDLATLPEDLHYRRERMFAIAAACRFERWLLHHVAENRIPLDECLRPVTLLPIYVEAMLLLRVKFPAYSPILIPDDDEQDAAFWTPQTEREAISVGLSVRRVKRGEKRPVANLPGCAGDGGRCPEFRRFGERFCHGCRRVELERLRTLN